jgi:hypothetical protein
MRFDGRSQVSLHVLFGFLRLTDKGGNGGVALCLWDPGQHLCAEHCAYIFHLCRAGWRVAALLASTKSS